MDENQKLDYFFKLRCLLGIDGIGNNKLLNLISKFTSLERLFNSDFQSLIAVDGISSNLANRILKQIYNFNSCKDSFYHEIVNLKKLRINFTTYWSPDYPKLLKQIYSPPAILYYKGNLEKTSANKLAIVGTRLPTDYGKLQAENFSKELAKQGITIVSGLARGIDTIAHKSCLAAGGKTIAIIGSGLDVYYPAENKKLFDMIAENGVVLSEYELGTKPDAQNFPKRNRIISGISLGTVVIETKLNGGALQTARFALDQNREVFAIPGNLGFNQSEGTNKLIQKGEAKLVTNAEDILIELNLKTEPLVGKNIPKPELNLNLFEQKIYDTLSKDPKHIDLISSEAGINSSECLVHLLSLEFRDLVKQFPGKTFVLA